MRVAKRIGGCLLGFGFVASACTGGVADESFSESTETTSATEPHAEAEVLAADEVESLGERVLDPIEIAENWLVWVHDEEPITMHYDDPAARLTAASWIRQSLLEGLYGVSGATEYYPELLADEGEVVEEEDGSVTVSLTLRNDLRWSNGDPLTAEHVAYTWDIWREGCEQTQEGTLVDGPACVYRATDRQGFDLVTEVVVLSDTEFTISFSRFYAGWKGLFDEIYHPDFGATAAEVNEHLESWTTADGGVLPSSGPMMFESWERGVAMRLATNESYHGSVSPDARNRGTATIDGVVVRFVPDVETLVRAIESGEGQVMMADPQVGFGDRLSGRDDLAVVSTAGPVFEHWGLNLLNPHLADPLVREALVLAIDKSEVVVELYRPLFGNVLPANGLGNALWMTNQRFHEDHQVPYSGAQPATAAEKLEEAGYALAGGVFEHPERGRLSLRVGTTGGDSLREGLQAILADQLTDASFEIVIDNVDGDDYFTAQPFHPDALLASITGGDDGDATIWDIAQFAWAGRPWPGVNVEQYRAGSASNPYGFANPEFDALAGECDGMIDNVDRAACYNALDLYLTTLTNGDDGLFVIPITQTPAYFGFRSDMVSGPGTGSGADAAGPLVNVADFSFR